MVRAQTSHGKVKVTFNEKVPDNLEIVVDGNRVEFQHVDGRTAEVTVLVGVHEIAVWADGEDLREPEKVSVPRFGKASPLVVTLEPRIVRDSGPSKPQPPSRVSPVLGDGPDQPVSMTGHRGPCGSLVFTRNGERAVSLDDGHLFVWELQKRKLGYTRPFPDNFGGTGIVRVSPNDEIIAGVSPNGNGGLVAVVLFDRKTLTPIGQPIKCDVLSSFVFSSDSSLLATAEFSRPNGNRARVVDVRTRKVLNEFQLGSNDLTSVAFSPDGKFVLTGSGDKVFRLWNIKADGQEREFRAHEGGISGVGYSTDGRRIFSASTSDGTLRVWDAATGKELKQIQMGKTAGPMLCVTFWRGGRALTGHKDGTVILWDLDKAEELKRFSHKNAAVTAVDISPDGCHAVSAVSTDNLVYLYRLPPP